VRDELNLEKQYENEIKHDVQIRGAHPELVEGSSALILQQVQNERSIYKEE
jgi:hypothetical protein